MKIQSRGKGCGERNNKEIIKCEKLEKWILN